jgi:hypothetical protein
MLKMEKETRETGCLRLRGHRVVALKPEFAEHAVELEKALPDGVPAYRDLVRPGFYYVVMEDRQDYIHVYRRTKVVYLVAHSTPATLDAVYDRALFLESTK